MYVDGEEQRSILKKQRLKYTFLGRPHILLHKCHLRGQKQLLKSTNLKSGMEGMAAEGYQD